MLDCLQIARADKMMSIETCRLAESPLIDEKPVDISEKTLNVVLKKKVMLFSIIDFCKK